MKVLGIGDKLIKVISNLVSMFHQMIVFIDILKDKWTWQKRRSYQCSFTYVTLIRTFVASRNLIIFLFYKIMQGHDKKFKTNISVLLRSLCYKKFKPTYICVTKPRSGHITKTADPSSRSKKTCDVFTSKHSGMLPHS